MDDLDGVGDPDVARVVGSIRNRLAEAEAQLSELEQRSLSQGETPEVLKRKELEDQLEARKARLGLAEPPAPRQYRRSLRRRQRPKSRPRRSQRPSLNLRLNLHP